MLFHMTQPTRAYFGQKDYQQLLIIKQMVRDLKIPVWVRICPTVREPDGLAMSSRNQYLSAAQRREAAVLYQALYCAKASIRAGQKSATVLVRQMRRLIQQQPSTEIDYAAIVDARTLLPLKRLKGKEQVAILLAVRLGRARLIDNLLMRVS
jgi:pantoate--beta-alanine ligase